VLIGLGANLPEVTFILECCRRRLFSEWDELPDFRTRNTGTGHRKCSTTKPVKSPSSRQSLLSLKS